MLVGITFQEKLTRVGWVLELIRVSCMKMLHGNVLGLWHVWQPVLKRVSHTSSYSATVIAGFGQKVGNTVVMWLGLLGEKRHRADPRRTRLLGNQCRAVASDGKGSQDRTSLNREAGDLSQAWEGWTWGPVFMVTIAWREHVGMLIKKPDLFKNGEKELMWGLARWMRNRSQQAIVLWCLCPGRRQRNLVSANLRLKGAWW